MYVARRIDSCLVRFCKVYTSRFTPEFSRQQLRHLSLHEYQCMKLLKDAGVHVPRGEVASTAAEVKKLVESFGGAGVVKAQVHAGGRGKGKFETGLNGGVQFPNSVEDAENVANKMLGKKLITKQTGTAGRPCNKVLVCEKLTPSKEYYFAIVMDRAYKGPVIMASSEGGMDIEEVAKTRPQSLVWQPIDITEGLDQELALSVAKKLDFHPDYQQMASEQMVRLYKVLIENDATMVEINPMTEDKNGQVYCMDVKMNIDDNSQWRQQQLFEMRDYSQEDPMEVKATRYDLNYIKLDGSIGCVVNGAGLAMATMDVIKLYGGEPANFLDIGGGASKKQVTKAFEIICSDSNVKVILVNIFGGIIRCDEIAQGIIEAVSKINSSIPIIVRLQGNNVDDAKALFADSEITKRIVSQDDFGRAAKIAAKLANKQTQHQNGGRSLKFPYDDNE